MRVRADASAASRSATFDVPLYGAHNVRNALAALAVGARGGPVAGRDAPRRSAEFRRRAAPARAARRGARRLGLRRLRASSDRDSRDAARGALVASRPPDLGGLRAAVGDVVPARVPGRLRARVRRVRRRRGHPRAGVPRVAARRRAAVGRRARARHHARPAATRVTCPTCRRHRRDDRAPRRATAISSSSCRTAASTASTTSCWRALAALTRDVDRDALRRATCAALLGRERIARATRRSRR